jgi:hypothetical protein
MRLLLATMARTSGEPMLRDVVDIMRDSFDEVRIIYDNGRPIDDFAKARNRMAREAEDAGFDWVLMLDADECMYPADIQALRRVAEERVDYVALPRINFVNDRQHWDATEYPDYQVRFFRLGRGLHYRGQVHEMLFARGGRVPLLFKADFPRSDGTPIYHYGKAKSAEQVLAKFVHYESILEGSTALHELDLSSPQLWPGSPRFEHPHPLDGTRSASGDWGSVSKVVLSPRQDIQVLVDHADLVAGLWSRAGSHLATGVESLPIARYLAQRGKPVLFIGDADTVASAEAAFCPSDLLRYAIADPAALGHATIEGSYSVAFSLGELHRLDRESLLRRIDAMLQVAPAVVFSVPSDRNPVAAVGGARVASPEEWARIVGVLGRVSAAYYGTRTLPLRSALAAKICGSLYQDRLHVVVTINRT